MSEMFYRAFEDRYRGSRELIKSRLLAYLPFFAPLVALYPRAKALDLGCGRGEWLELLNEHGYAAHGVDLDEGMLAACRERNLDVELTDALSSLRKHADASVALVSAFHLVEHIPFDQVQLLIAEALRVLQPGGLLIMETPNSENLVVGASSFYMDPSHLRPLPSQLLDFVVDYSGFARHKILRLQEAAQLHTDAAIGLINVLDGVSPDYAVIGQKAAPPQLLKPFEQPFQDDYGISLANLAQRYEQQEEARRKELHVGLGALAARVSHDASVNSASLDSLHKGVARVGAGVESNRQRLDANAETLDQLRPLINQLEQVTGQTAALSTDLAHQTALNTQLVQQLAAIEQRSHDLAAQLEAGIAAATLQYQQHEMRLQQNEARAHSAEMEAVQQRQRIADLLASSSWRLTAPLRLLAGSVYRVRAATREGRIGSGLKRRVKQGLKGPLLQLIDTVQSHPRLKMTAMRVLQRYPSLYARLQRMQRRGNHAEPQSFAQPAVVDAPSGAPATMSPRAMRRYEELKQAIARNH